MHFRPQHDETHLPRISTLRDAVTGVADAGGNLNVTGRLPPVESELAMLKIVGVLLILAGVAALIYGGFSYTSREKAVDIGPVQIDKTEHHSLPISPILGVVAIVGGAVLVYSGAKAGR